MEYIKFKSNTVLHVVVNVTDPENPIVETEDVVAGTLFRGDIVCENDDNTVDIQFADGSVAFGVSRGIIEVEHV